MCSKWAFIKSRLTTTNFFDIYELLKTRQVKYLLPKKLQYISQYIFFNILSLNNIRTIY